MADADYTAEPDVLNLVKVLLERDWDRRDGKIPKPSIHFHNELGRANQASAKADQLIMAYGPSAETEEWEGHAKEYMNYRARIEVKIWTIRGRQAMHDLKAEIRRIVHQNKVSLYTDGYQILSYLGFAEDVEPAVRNWRGTVTLEMDSAGVILDT